MTWTIDKSRTKLEFAVRHMMIHTVRGSFRDYDVQLNINESELGQSSVKAQIETKSVTTKDSLRDDYLTSANFFNPSEHPFITFESTSARVTGKKISVSGRLKIRDIEKQLILNGAFKGPQSGFGGGPRRLSFDLNGEIEREAYNLVFNGAVETVSIVVGKKVNLLLNIELVES